MFFLFTGLEAQEALDFKDQGTVDSREGLLNFRDNQSIFVDPDTIEGDSPNSTFRIGNADFLLSANYQMAYESNITFLNGGVSDLVQTVGGGLGVTIVDPRIARLTLAANYKPSYFLYLDNDNFNNLAHDANLSAAYNWDQSYLKANTGYSINQNPIGNIGGQITRESWDGGLDWRWFFSGKTQYQARLDYGKQVFSRGQGFVGNEIETYNHTQWLGYQIFPKLFLGPELGLQYSETQLGQSILAEFVRLRAEYDPSEKLSVGVFVGAQFSQFPGGENANTSNYGGSITWSPLVRTSFGINFGESETATIINGARSQISRVVNLNVSQRIGSKIGVSGSVGYDQIEFQSLGAGGSRDDEGFNVRITGGYVFNWGMTSQIFYQLRSNDSTLLRNNFDSHRVGFNLGYRF